MKMGDLTKKLPNSGNWIECPRDIHGKMTIWKKGRKPDREGENDRNGERSQNVRRICNGCSVRYPWSNDELAKTAKTWQKSWKKQIWWKITRLREMSLVKGSIWLNDESCGNGENLSGGWKVVNLARKITKGLTQIEMRLQKIFW